MALPLPLLTAVPALPALLEQGHGPKLGELLPVWSVAPFAALLLSIAILPLVAAHWWEHNKNRAIVSFSLAIGFAIWILSTHGGAAAHLMEEVLLDYVSFMALLGSLYVISGGIYLRGSLAGSPLSNTAVLGIGAVLANLIGTTGASMVLIRPLLRANQSRQRKTHVVIFFIFVVSNCGGLLTPLGDPPLFLGFLRGVPFEWTLTLWKEWLGVNSALLILFLIVDNFVLDREEVARRGSQLEQAMKHEKLGIEGLFNVPLLAGVILVILAKGNHWFLDRWPFGLQEGLMFLLAAVAYATTRVETRHLNRFTFGPILEVAILFLGIFVTMVAPLAILNARGSELGLTQAWHYFWGTGLLSSFLDNAPTYLTLAATAAGQVGVAAEGSQYLGHYLQASAAHATTLSAISCGAVFMGANTYIGNGPNFMVKAIAEENGIKMPTFFGYMAWSFGILVPIFVGVTFLFFV